MDYDFLKVSNGSGDAALMHINADRAISNTTLHVDTIANVPTKFIGTYGTLLPSGFIDPSTQGDIKAHISGSDVIIDAFEPGTADAGNTNGQVLIIKPNTGWSNRVAGFIMNATNFGTPGAITVDDLTAADITADTLTINSAVLLDGLVSATYRHTVTSAELAAGYIQLTFAHGLAYTPHVDARFGLGTTPTTFYPLPNSRIVTKSYFGIPPSLTVAVTSVDSTNIHVNIAVTDSDGSAFIPDTTLMKFQFYCSPFPAVAL